jgi:hypothetical protein
VGVNDLDEFAGIAPAMSGREALLTAVDVAVKLSWEHTGLRKVRDLAVLLAYADWRVRDGCRGGGRKTTMDVDEMVTVWADVLVGLSTAHAQQDHTNADHLTDVLLGPLLTAPVAQLRQFAERLGDRLEADERVPFMVWMGFKRVVLPMFASRPPGEVVALKTALAKEVAELAERGLDRGQLVAAIAGALQWRGAETLTKVKDALESGHTPKLEGRESCLFLTVEGVEGLRVVL